MRDIRFIPEPIRKKRRVQDLLARYFGNKDGRAEADRPLKFPKHMTTWWDKKGFRRQGKWFDTWRDPNGRFAKRPLPGERKRNLNL